MPSNSLAAFIAKAWEAHHLLSLTLELTDECDQHCSFCYIDRQQTGPRLSVEDYKRLLQEARSLGCLFLLLTGGEALLHPDFFAIGAFARSLGFSIRLKTHGAFGDGDRVVQRIRQDIDPTWVDVSLHGPDAAGHDAITGRSGSFDRVMTNLSLFRTHGFNVQLRCLLTGRNVSRRKEMLSLAKHFGCPIVFDHFVSKRRDGERSSEIFRAAPDELRSFFSMGDADPSPESISFLDEEAQDRMVTSQQSSYYCGAGVGNLLVDPHGRVFPCIEWRFQVGNLLGQTLGDIWNNSNRLQELREKNRAMKIKFAEGKVISAVKDMPYCPGREDAECNECRCVDETVG